ncbi:hypothetical protein BD626DRAFT_474889 [Schizophyllum amplum]|uniref:Zn(2)-C6 fungal-type domain-containing protein n=1 Tax=Schizophyllum amplum TaxID=97359 RepID=A0A550CXY1_9AGAR|nr:hypothetical protein BD626DRAFT_474889 [Auriculariopsis ampla]
MAQEPIAGPSTENGTAATVQTSSSKIYTIRPEFAQAQTAAVRCDSCKASNTKCDRLLPFCTNCVVAQKSCGYTPYSASAHKGVVSCTACSIKDIECDRTFPVCNQCEDLGAACQYAAAKMPASSRKRSKASESAMIVSDASAEEADEPESEERSQPARTPAPAPPRTVQAPPQPAQPVSGRYSSHYRDGPTGYPAAVNKRIIYNTASGVKRQHYCFVPAALPRAVIAGPHLHPWINPSFVALPHVIHEGMASIPPVEMPDRITFHTEMNKFLGNVLDEQRHTICLGQEQYAEIADALALGKTAELAPWVSDWITCHRLMSGSDRAGLILVPRDATFEAPRKVQERLRLTYQCHVDGTTQSPLYRSLPPMDLLGLEWLSAFERLPVKEQVYDILAYAHRGHGSTTLMLMEAQRLGFAAISWPMAQLFCDLCPLCNRQTLTKFRNVSYSVT